ncbi:MAG: hypothetical protein V1735_05105 [Nanoarchaeota archaeon]
MDKPEIKFRAGAISATVWNNETKAKDGSPAAYKTISLQRSFKDKEGVWKNTASFRTADIPKAMVVLNKAYEHLVLAATENGDDE